MTLAQRLAQAKQAQVTATPAPAEPARKAAKTSKPSRESAPKPKPRGGDGRDPFENVRRSVHQTLIENLGPTLYDPHMSQADLEQKVKQTLQGVLEREETPLSSTDRARLAQEIADDILGYGPLEPLLRDGDVTEVMVNGPDQIYVERQGQISLAAARFGDETHLRRTIDKIVARVGRRVDEASPMVDARLPDGSRVNAVVPPIALDGSMLTIRKFGRPLYKR